ncbi:MAG: heat-inducible transcriptional repressor HrcA [Nitrosomonadales bacterium]|nr:heat-inducible transcriptional repressor HrcA [Nitrosomonadales bacterium]MBT6232186.1 heat-inducible transcriptional repressor HrcA [Nitrosomonadales bacterium]MBT6355998.1 heat-inducible transcriptional repressor HrcA [Nitrosomonadales bacterium]
MDTRTQHLLKTLINHHIVDGQPVGSKTLTASSGLELSSASIRNIMKDLEDAGFISSPHTSAGRVPTQKGYRFFVDSLVTMKSPNKSDLDMLQNSLNTSNTKELINITADTLSSLTNFAGVVMLPKAKKISFKHIEFLNLSKTRILVIIVTSDGSVQNRVLDTQEEYDQSTLIEASNFFNEHYKDLDINLIKEKIIEELSTMKKNMTSLMSAAVELSINPKLDENLILAGQRNLLDTVDLSQNVKSIKKIIELFEKKTSLLQLLEKSHHSSGMQIFIGEESGYQALDECSIVTAPYQSDGEVIGILGVIGPTRMAYERVIPIVDITAKMLSKSIK